MAFKRGLEKGMALEGSVCPGLGAFPLAWSEPAPWSAVTSPLRELFRHREAVGCRDGGESERDRGCTPVPMLGEAGSSHSPTVQGHFVRVGGQRCVA